MIPEAKINQEIKSMTLCVAGLSFILTGVFVLMDKFSLSVLLGIAVGSAASVGNFMLNIYTAKFSAKHDQKQASSIVILSKVSRAFLMGVIAYVILLVPLLHDMSGIVALFFPQISRAILYITKR